MRTDDPGHAYQHKFPDVFQSVEQPSRLKQQRNKQSVMRDFSAKSNDLMTELSDDPSWHLLQRHIDERTLGTPCDVRELVQRKIREHSERLDQAPLEAFTDKWLWEGRGTEMLKAISGMPTAFLRLLQRLRQTDPTDVMGNPGGLNFDIKHGELRSDCLGDDGGSVLGLFFLTDARSVDPAARTRSLSLKNNGIGDFGATQIFASCKAALPQLEKLILDQNCLGTFAMEALAAAAAEGGALTGLKWLHLNENRDACRAEEGALALARALLHMPALEELCLNGVSLSPDGAETISTQLLANLDAVPLLRRLNLNFNAIGDKGVTSLCSALTMHPRATLTRIQLDGVGLSDRGAQSLVLLQRPGRSIEAKNEGILDAAMQAKLKAPPMAKSGADSGFAPEQQGQPRSMPSSAQPRVVPPQGQPASRKAEGGHPISSRGKRGPLLPIANGHLRRSTAATILQSRARCRQARHAYSRRLADAHRAAAIIQAHARRRSVQSWVWVPADVVVDCCSSPQDLPRASPREQHFRHVEVVTAKGAVIHPDGWGVTVTVPTGAVRADESVHIELRASFEWSTGPTGEQVVSPLLCFSPASYAFQQPISFRFPHCSAGDPTQLRAWATPDGSMWASIGVDDFVSSDGYVELSSSFGMQAMGLDEIVGGIASGASSLFGRLTSSSGGSSQSGGSEGDRDQSDGGENGGKDKDGSGSSPGDFVGLGVTSPDKRLRPELAVYAGNVNCPANGFQLQQIDELFQTCFALYRCYPQDVKRVREDVRDEIADFGCTHLVARSDSNPTLNQSLQRMVLETGRVNASLHSTDTPTGMLQCINPQNERVDLSCELEMSEEPTKVLIPDCYAPARNRSSSWRGQLRVVGADLQAHGPAFLPYLPSPRGGSYTIRPVYPAVGRSDSRGSVEFNVGAPPSPHCSVPPSPSDTGKAQLPFIDGRSSSSDSLATAVSGTIERPRMARHLRSPLGEAAVGAFAEFVDDQESRLQEATMIAETAAHIASGAVHAAVSANISAEIAQTTADGAAAAAQRANELHGVPTELLPALMEATVRIGVLNRETGKLMDCASGTIIDGGDGAPLGQVLTSAHPFIDVRKVESFRVEARAAAGAQSTYLLNGKRMDVTTPVGVSRGESFTVSVNNPNYLKPLWCLPTFGSRAINVDWQDSDAKVIIAIGTFQGQDQPSRWTHWAELVTPLSTLQKTSATHWADDWLLDLAVLRICGKLDLADPNFRGKDATYNVTEKHPAAEDLGLPLGRPLGDDAQLNLQQKLTCLGYPYPMNEKTIWCISGTLQSKEYGLFFSDLRMPEGSSGGGTFDARGHLVAVNQASTRLQAVWLPPKYKAYSRMVSLLTPEHELERSFPVQAV